MKIKYMYNYYNDNHTDIRLYNRNNWNQVETSFEHCIIDFLLIRKKYEDKT